MSRLEEKIIAGSLGAAAVSVLDRWELGKQYGFRWPQLTNQEKDDIQRHKTRLLELAETLYAQHGNYKPLRILDPLNQFGVTIYHNPKSNQLEQAYFYSLINESMPPSWIVGQSTSN